MSLQHTDVAFLKALEYECGKIGLTETYIQHTGGGCMVAVVDLSIDARGNGAQVWITREDDWLVGFYDFGNDPEDEGECLSLMTFTDQRDDAEGVARKIARTLDFFNRSFVQLAAERGGS